jgi:hypothetical protein
MKRRVRPAFWVECALGSVTTFLALLTVAWPDWIEGVFGYDPDQHSGSLERTIVALCFVITIVTVLLARHEWRRAASSAR